jgi:hypothetical protein
VEVWYLQSLSHHAVPMNLMQLEMQNPGRFGSPLQNLEA